MSSNRRSGIVRTFGARIAAWYFALFVAGALLIVLGADILLSTSLAGRDRDALTATLLRYTDAYAQGGAGVLEDVIAADRAGAGYEPVFVRVVAAGRTRILSVPVEWTSFDLAPLQVPGPGRTAFQTLSDGRGRTLEVLSALLRDDTLFQVGRTTERRAALLDRYRESMLMLLGLVVVAGLLGGWLLTWQALQPLRDLSFTLTRILETGRTSERVTVRGTDDPLDALGALVNRMLQRIDGLVIGMRTTLDAVAHDLRTPMTRLRGTAEVALQSGGSADDYREALADCLEEAARVSGLLDALMDLAEAETGAMRLQRATIDLVAVVNDAVGLYAEVAEDKGLTLAVVNPQETLPLTGDRIRLTQVFANLIDNAVKYAPGPGHVTVTITGTPDSARVLVDDSGPGIAPEERERIWERLYRGDLSRSERGLGIGLSLVRAITQAHGGRVNVEPAPEGGARFIVELPRQMTQM
jgi:signal transduction histidine kinase